jgi:transglycosylase-like protein
MATLLGALLRNESGGRNIPNVHQGTSSGQAQGYFQITTGTWDEFGGRKYAPTPLQATKEQQADIASKIPLKRWDPSTLAVMRATGKPIDPNRTLGENLAMHGENITDFAAKDGQPAQAYAQPNQYALPAATQRRGPDIQSQALAQPPVTSADRLAGQSFAASGAGPNPIAAPAYRRSPVAGQSYVGTGTATLGPAAPAPYTTPVVGSGAVPGSGGGVPGGAIVPASQQQQPDQTNQPNKDSLWDTVAGLGNAYGKPIAGNPFTWQNQPTPGPARIDQGAVPTIDVNQQAINQQRMQLALALLNRGRLVG